MTQAIDNPFVREAMKNDGGHSQEERIAVCEAHITMEAETTDEWKHSLTPEILWTPFGVIDRTNTNHSRKSTKVRYNDPQNQLPISIRKTLTLNLQHLLHCS